MSDGPEQSGNDAVIQPFPSKSQTRNSIRCVFASEPPAGPTERRSPTGGHFAASEQPELFSEEVRAGFRSLG